MRNWINPYVIMIIFVLLLLSADLSYAIWIEQAKLTASDGATGDCFGRSVSVDGGYSIVGARYDDDNGTDSGSAYIFESGAASWNEQSKLTASDSGDWDCFGYSVSISGEYAIVGVVLDDNNGSDSGSAYIFARDGSNWIQQDKLTALDGDSGDYFGWSVSISGCYAIVGACGDDDRGSNSGSVYIFKHDGGSWVQQSKITAFDGSAGDWFGYSVSISGGYAIVGAQCNDVKGTDSGSAYIFTISYFDPNQWDLVAKLIASDGVADDRFGYSVSISGDYAIVGAVLDDDKGLNSGSAYIFKREGYGWGEQAKLTASDGANWDWFGYSVSVSSGYALVGAVLDDDKGLDSGSAYIFAREGESWSEQAKLTASDGAAYDRFGTAVSISDGYAVIGAHMDDDKADASGSAYIYFNSPCICGVKWHDTDGDCEKDADEQRLPGCRIYIDINENGQFDAGEPYDLTDAGGNYVLPVCTGTWVLGEEAGTCWEQTCPGGDEIYHVMLEDGEALEGYNFGNARLSEIHPSRWQEHEQAKLIASDGVSGDYFGRSVAISGGYIIVGAFGDDSRGTDSGSAYIFGLNGANCSDWDHHFKLIASDGTGDDRFGQSVSISGGYAIIGASGDDDSGMNSGSAYIFKYNVARWSEQAKLVALDGAGGDWFGYSVSISGDYAIIGASGDEDNGSDSGSAYIFKRDGESWNEQIKLNASDGAAYDHFGISVSMSGSYAIVGAEYDDDNGINNSGSAYIFRYDGESWSEQAKLTASDGAVGDCFGYSVSISGDYAIVGAVHDDDNGDSSGSAYIFKLCGESWSEHVKLTASDGNYGDRFGNSVSTSGAYAIIGAYADGDNGDLSGSAYIFSKILYPSADLNDDCAVDLVDFAIFGLAWMTQPGDLNWNSACNIAIPADSYIDWRDLEILCDSWLAEKP